MTRMKIEISSSAGWSLISGAPDQIGFGRDTSRLSRERDSKEIKPGPVPGSFCVRYRQWHKEHQLKLLQ